LSPKLDNLVPTPPLGVPNLSALATEPLPKAHDGLTAARGSEPGRVFKSPLLLKLADPSPTLQVSIPAREEGRWKRSFTFSSCLRSKRKKPIIITRWVDHYFYAVNASCFIFESLHMCLENVFIIELVFQKGISFDRLVQSSFKILHGNHCRPNKYMCMIITSVKQLNVHINEAVETFWHDPNRHLSAPSPWCIAAFHRVRFALWPARIRVGQPDWNFHSASLEPVSGNEKILTSK